MRKITLTMWVLVWTLIAGAQSTPQWFVSDLDIPHGQAPHLTPDYRASGTFVNSQDNSVFVYGTIGYNHGSVGTNFGGHGGSDIFIARKDVNGNVMWRYLLGTEDDDVIVRLVANAQGFITVAGYTVTGGTNRAFIARYAWGGTLVPLWQHYFDEGTPTDLIATHREDEIENGWAMCGNWNNAGFVVSVDQGGAIRFNKRYASALNQFPFYSLTENQVGDGTTNPKSIVLAGDSPLGGLGATRVNNIDGTVLFSTWHSLPICAAAAQPPHSEPQRFNRVISDKNNDLVFFGNGGAMLKSNSGLTQISWARSVMDDPTFAGLDVRETLDGYLALGRSSQSQIEVHLLHVDRSGNLLDHWTPGTPTYSYDVSDNGAPMFSGPTISLSIEDGYYAHYSLTESQLVGTGRPWFINHALHVKTNLGQRTCDESAGTFATLDCGTNNITEYNNESNHDASAHVYSSNGLNLQSPPNQLAISNPQPGDDNVYCDYACDPVEINQTLQLCPGGSLVIGVPNFQGQQSTSFWSTGETASEITITEAGTYALYYYFPLSDFDCPEIYTYVVEAVPEPVITELEPCCSNGLGGNICFAPNDDLNATITYNGSPFWSGIIPGNIGSCLATLSGSTISSGNYVITATDAQGCNWFWQIDLSCNTGCKMAVEAEETEMVDADLLVFPNPTRDQLTLQFGQPVTGTVTITDLTGRIVQTETMSEVARMNLNLDFQGQGTYLMIVETDGKKITRRIVKSN